MTINPTLNRLISTFKAEITEMESRIESMAERLSDFRRGEAKDLALSKAEQERLEALRVLAAAPELLEALKVAEFAVQQAADFRQIPEEDRAALHMIRGAIAKAEEGR